MKAKTTKILSALMIVAMILMIVGNIAYAATSPKDFSGTDSFSGKESISSLGNSVIGLVRLVGTILAVFILIVLGIKYMMGSTEEKAEYKKSFIPYIVGAIIIFAASWLSGIIYDWASSLK